MFNISVPPVLRMTTLRSYFRTRNEARLHAVRTNLRASSGLSSDPRAYGSLAAALMAPVGVVAR